MKDSASPPRCVAAAALTRWKRPPSIWRSSGVMSLSLQADRPRPAYSDARGQSKASARLFRSRGGHASAAPAPAGAPLLMPADRLGEGRLRPRFGLLSLRRGFACQKKAEEQSTMANVVVVGAQWG